MTDTDDNSKPLDRRTKEGRAKKRTGPIYSKDLIDKICTHLVANKSLRQISKLPGYPNYNTILKWSVRDPYAIHRFKEARTEHFEERRRDDILDLKSKKLADLAIECTNMAKDDKITPSMATVLFKEEVADIKYKIELLFKELAIEFPDKYGNKIHTKDLTDPVKGKSAPELSINIMEALKVLVERQDVLMSSPEDMKQATDLLKKGMN